MLFLLIALLVVVEAFKPIDWTHCNPEPIRRHVFSQDKRSEYRLENIIEVQDNPPIPGANYKISIQSKLLKGTLVHPSLTAIIEQDGQQFGMPFKKELCSKFKCPVEEGEERKFFIDYFIPRAPERFLEKPFSVTVEIVDNPSPGVYEHVDCVKFDIQVEIPPVV